MQYPKSKDRRNDNWVNRQVEGRVMENVVQAIVQQEDTRGSKNVSKKSWKKWIYTLGGIVVAGGLALGGLFYYQNNHFNSHFSINGSNVGGLTVEQALQKLETTVSKNQIYIGKTLVVDEGQTKAGFAEQDLSNVQKVLSTQRTFLPTSKAQNYTLLPTEVNQNQSQTMNSHLEQKLTAMNKNLKAPQDAQVELQQGKVVVTESVPGQQYDISAMLQQFQKQQYNSVIVLNPVYRQPVKVDDPIIQKDKAALQAVLGRTINYTVQDKVYALKGSDLIKNVDLSKNIQITVNTDGIISELNKINASQSTLGKNFQFKTTSGGVISVQGQTYGWALNVNKEAKAIQQAFETEQTSVVASSVYGKGWNTGGIGFKNTTNYGIGATYAEVSIAQQRIWLYKNGKMVLTTNVVTGRKDVGEDTHPGVWYIEYKQSPAVLVGSEVGMSNYHVPVNYWAPFTLDGEGFHDASWRSNWTSTAYLHSGSGGCVNTPPSVMPSLYKNLSVNEPVVVY